MVLMFPISFTYTYNCIHWTVEVSEAIEKRGLPVSHFSLEHAFVVDGINVTSFLYLIFQEINDISVRLQRALYANYAMQFFVKFAIIRKKLLLKIMMYSSDMKHECYICQYCWA
jgi:hypothetical protein